MNSWASSIALRRTPAQAGFSGSAGFLALFRTRNVSNGNNAKYGNHVAHNSHSSRNSHPILPARGDYRSLLSFQKAEVVYDITFRFAHKFLAKGDRTIDQMIQAARSGKKNILEGSKAGTTSKETEIKLTNIARASL